MLLATLTMKEIFREFIPETLYNLRVKGLKLARFHIRKYEIPDGRCVGVGASRTSSRAVVTTLYALVYYACPIYGLIRHVRLEFFKIKFCRDIRRLHLCS